MEIMIERLDTWVTALIFAVAMLAFRAAAGSGRRDGNQLTHAG
jgi:hypothetical protein